MLPERPRPAGAQKGRSLGQGQEVGNRPGLSVVAPGFGEASDAIPTWGLHHRCRSSPSPQTTRLQVSGDEMPSHLPARLFVSTVESFPPARALAQPRLASPHPLAPKSQAIFLPNLLLGTHLSKRTRSRTRRLAPTLHTPGVRDA